MKLKGVQKLWERYKYVLPILVIGVLLLAWPSGKRETQSTTDAETSAPRTRKLQEEMEAVLSKIEGVGQARVLLTEETDGETELAQDTQLSYSGDRSAPEDYSRSSEAVKVENGSDERIVVTRRCYPTYRGALIVCQGGDRTEVRLTVTQAVSALTGLPSDRITVAKYQSSYGGGKGI
ncbi:MAG: hypothetical protein IKN53_03990 [Oscillibacter sp.]|nr:hypothetical protein [Oscillibacter sp.]